MDGVLDIWDYFYRQNEVAYSHKVGRTVKASGLTRILSSLDDQTRPVNARIMHEE